MAEQQQSLKQPKELYMLFFAEMWERFSYYGMRALLILFMVKHFLYSDDQAYGVYAAYGSLVYTTPFLGGIIADKFLGYRKSVMLGASLMAIGHFVMVGPDILPKEYHEASFFTALAFLIVGNGFFKPNISSIVGTLYGPNDARRDAGFTIFYMGVNLGAFFAPLVCGLVGEIYGWGYGFSLAGIGMLIGLFVFTRGQKGLGERGLPPAAAQLTPKKEWIIYTAAVVLVGIVIALIQLQGIISKGLTAFAVCVLSYLLFTAVTKLEKVERERMFVILTLLLFSAIFWAFFEQAGSSITLFTDRNVDRLGIPASVFQSVNPMYILIFGGVFSALWMNLAKKGKDLSVPVKFALGLVQLAAGFGALVIGASTASEAGMVSLFWLMLGYLLHTTGELCLSPVGLSMVTKLAPKVMVAMVVGGWYLSSSLAHTIGGTIARFTSTSAYMESAIVYTPSIGFEGTDSLTYVAHKTDENGKTVATSEPITLVFNTVKGFEGEINTHKPQAYTRYFAIKPNEKLTENIRFKQLDPFGDFADITIKSNAKNGTAVLNGDELTYTPNADFVGIDTIELLSTEKANSNYADLVHLVVTVDNETFHKPVVIKNRVEYTIPASTAFTKTEFNANVLNFVADPNGGNLNIEILSKPNLKNALASDSRELNAFVSPRKTIGIYSNVFQMIMYFAFGAAIVLFLLSPLLNKWMHTDKPSN